MLIDDPDLNEISDFSKNTHENTGLFGVLTMFESSVSHVFHDDFALQIAKKACIGKPLARQRERKCFVISAAETMSKKSRRNSVRSHFLQTFRKFYSDGWDLRERLQRRARQFILGEKSIQMKSIPEWVQDGDPKFWPKKFRIRVTTRAWISKTTNVESQSMGRSSSTRERVHLCSRLVMKDHLHEESCARSCRENWRIEKKRLSRGNCWKTVKIGRISCAAWSGITNSESILLRSWLTEQLWRSSCYFEFEKA